MEEWEFSVEDTGEGIERKYHEIIFEDERLVKLLVHEIGWLGFGIGHIQSICGDAGGNMWSPNWNQGEASASFRVPMIKAKEVLEMSSNCWA